MALLLGILLCLDPDPADVDLEALAQRWGLTRATDAATGRETLRGSGVHLIVAPGLSTALWNGEARALSRPVRLSNGRVVVPDEVERFFAGRVAKPRAEAAAERRPAGRSSKGFRLVIDAGHGGAHTGGKSRGGLMEKDVTLDVAMRLRTLLEEYGVDVVMTRTTDAHLDGEVDDDLQKRVAIANRANPDFFMSIHANWHPTPAPRGWEVFVPRQLERSRMGSLAMAQEIAAQFRRLDTEDRGIKEAGFRVLRGTTAPAVLVELEFLSNARGERELGDPSHRQKLASLLFEAVKRYVGRK